MKITFGGMTRIGRKFGLVTENWIIPYAEYPDAYWNNVTNEYILGDAKYKYDGYFSYGLRYMGENLSIDFAFVNGAFIFEDIPTGIPIVGVVIPFGNK